MRQSVHIYIWRGNACPLEDFRQTLTCFVTSPCYSSPPLEVPLLGAGINQPEHSLCVALFLAPTLL